MAQRVTPLGKIVEDSVPSAVAGSNVRANNAQNTATVSRQLDDAYERKRLAGFADWLKKQRAGDMAAGEAWAKDKFGPGNKDMAEILRARKDLAFGSGTDAQTALMRDQGIQGINSQMATGLRGLKGMQGLSGLRGGAALGQALPTLAKANQARSALESSLALNALQRRDQALKDYESTLTGERAGALGAQFGFAGLGSQDRSGGMQYLLGRDFVDAARAAVNAGSAGSDKAKEEDPKWWEIGGNGLEWLGVPDYENWSVKVGTASNSDGNQMTPWKRWG